MDSHYQKNNIGFTSNLSSPSRLQKAGSFLKGELGSLFESATTKPISPGTIKLAVGAAVLVGLGIVAKEPQKAGEALGYLVAEFEKGYINGKIKSYSEPLPLLQESPTTTDPDGIRRLPNAPLKPEVKPPMT